MTPEMLEKFRFEECTVIGLDENCWNWYGRVTTQGYATAYLEGSPRLLHRYVWEKLRGTIPDKLELDHLCRNRRCVNPAHMEPVTGAVNRDRVKNPPYRLKEPHEYEGFKRFSEMLRSAS